MEPRAERVVKDPLIGSVLHERYRVLRRIGRGGMGIVYLAEHVLIGRKYAIKTLSERANATPEMVARFHREALAAAAVGSDHIVEVTDMGQLDDGTYFIVLEYLEGVELAKAVLNEGPFSVSRAVKIACQLCDALTAVHQKGIVHRDLKPENLFLIEYRDRSDFLKVLDFGVCKLLDPPGTESGEQPALTRTNASLGTPQYMAPEQFHGSARVDQRADIHAVGAIVYFMLTGRPPFDAPSMAQLCMSVCVDPPPPLQLAHVPAALDRVLRRTLSKHPADRYPSSAALKAALQPFADLPSGPATSPITLPVGFGNPTLASADTRVPTVGGSGLLQAAMDTPVTSLPVRRWPRPLAAALLAVGLCLLSWGAWAVTDGDSALPTGSPRTLERKADSPAPVPAPADLPAAEAEVTTATGKLDTTRRARPTAPAVSRRASRSTEEPASAHNRETRATEPAAEPAPAPELAAPPASIEPSASQTPAPYRFPRRALKDVF